MGFFFDGGFQIFFFLVFFLVIGIFIFTIVQDITRWSKNNRSPRLIVTAQVVAKREDISYHRRNAGNGMVHHSSSTTYYVTFQVESGDRIELCVADTEYGMLVEGDRGKLSFQGTRYLGFERGY